MAKKLKSLREKLEGEKDLPKVVATLKGMMLVPNNLRMS